MFKLSHQSQQPVRDSKLCVPCHSQPGASTQIVAVFEGIGFFFYPCSEAGSRHHFFYFLLQLLENQDNNHTKYALERIS